MLTKLIILIGIVLLSVCVLSYFAIQIAKKAISKQRKKLSNQMPNDRYVKSGIASSWSHSSGFGGSGVAPAPELSEWEKFKREQEEKDQIEKEHKSIKEKLEAARREANQLNIQRHLLASLDGPEKKDQRKSLNRDAR